MSFDEETVWLLRLRSRDEAALKALYDRLSRPVLTLAMHLLRQREEAEEVLQDTFTRVYEHADRFDPDLGSARAFVYGVARREALTRLRRRHARPQHAEDGDGDLLVIAAPHEDLDDRAVVASVLTHLPERDRTLVREAFFLGFSHGELAERSHLPLGTVKTRLRRALLTLRRLLEPE